MHCRQILLSKDSGCDRQFPLDSKATFTNYVEQGEAVLDLVALGCALAVVSQMRV